MATSTLLREPAVQRTPKAPGPTRCRQEFLRFFPDGFRDETYFAWERDYKWEAHERWQEQLGRGTFRSLLKAGDFGEIASRAVRVESRTNLLFSFEKMALRDAVKSPAGARTFAEGLYDFLHGPGSPRRRFERWCEAVGSLPRRQTRVLTWPVVTVFGSFALPEEHIYLKPTATRGAAELYGFDFHYTPRPSWETYAGLLEFADIIRRNLRDLRPRDMIDVQSFIWVVGSDEYRHLTPAR
jgi:hypothetical protein